MKLVQAVSSLSFMQDDLIYLLDDFSTDSMPGQQEAVTKTAGNSSAVQVVQQLQEQLSAAKVDVCPTKNPF